MDADFETELARFRATHPLIRRDFAGAPWEYIACGQGEHTLVQLPGAPGIAEMAFRYIAAFEPHYRVLAPNYPPTITRAEQLIAGLAALIAAEAAGPVHLIGASYSGMVAQYLLRDCPERVASLLIGDTGIPRAARARAVRIALAGMSRLPLLGLHYSLYLIFSYVLYGKSPAHRFWQRYFKGIVATLTHSSFANRVRVWIDMDEGEQRLGPPPAWRGPTLLIETGDDPLFSAAERAALRARFPHAEAHTFYNRGHITALTQSSAYIRIMLDFLARHT